MPVSAGTEPWPGDTPPELRPVSRIEDGASVNVDRLTTSLHNGTHADAPRHVVEDGSPVDRLPLGPFVGPAVVVEAPAAFSLRGPELEREVPRGHRVLLRWGRRDHQTFPAEIPGVPPEWIDELAGREVPLLGTDMPSVDRRDSKALSAHRACVRHRIQVLENLVLADVEPGTYRLVALPLRLVGADASPVRAVLIEEDD